MQRERSANQLIAWGAARIAGTIALFGGLVLVVSFSVEAMGMRPRGGLLVAGMLVAISTVGGILFGLCEILRGLHMKWGLVPTTLIVAAVILAVSFAIIYGHPAWN